MWRGELAGSIVMMSLSREILRRLLSHPVYNRYSLDFWTIPVIPFYFISGASGIIAQKAWRS